MYVRAHSPIFLRTQQCEFVEMYLCIYNIRTATYGYKLWAISYDLKITYYNNVGRYIHM